MTYEDITRWRGFSHAELYAQLHSGPGASASAVPAQRWTDMASIFATIHQDLTKVIADAQGEWQGSSATSAFVQLGDVAAWASRVGANASSMKSSVEQQADHISKARAAMPKPGETLSLQPDPAAVAATQLLAAQTDHEPVERATSEAARTAHEVMQTYQNDTTATTGGLSRFDEIVDTSGVPIGKYDSQRGAIGSLPESVTAMPGPVAAGPVQTVSLASAEFLGLVADEPEVRARPSGGEHLGNSGGSAAAALAPRRGSSIRRTPARAPVPLDAHPIAPVAPAAATTGSGTERSTARRVGEPLNPARWADDAVEPPKRRRDWSEVGKITERVEGADAEVPPPVIGNGPYRP